MGTLWCSSCVTTRSLYQLQGEGQVTFYPCKKRGGGAEKLLSMLKRAQNISTPLKVTPCVKGGGGVRNKKKSLTCKFIVCLLCSHNGNIKWHIYNVSKGGGELSRTNLQPHSLALDT